MEPCLHGLQRRDSALWVAVCPVGFRNLCGAPEPSVQGGPGAAALPPAPAQLVAPVGVPACHFQPPQVVVQPISSVGGRWSFLTWLGLSFLLCESE